MEGGWIDAAGVLDGWLLVRWLGEGRGIKVKCRSLVISNLVSLQCWAVEVNHMYSTFLSEIVLMLNNHFGKSSLVRYR